MTGKGFERNYRTYHSEKSGKGSGSEKFHYFYQRLIRLYPLNTLTMKNVIAFLSELQANNNREWFEANKTRYKEIRQEFDNFVERLIPGIESFDSSIRGLTLKDCTYRIYRDTRFSTNKEPYKTHLGAYFCPGGKKSGYTGYYFHVEPKGNGMLGGHFLSAGAYMPEPNELKSIRDEIFDNGEQFLAAVKKAKGFNLSQENKLKRTPTGFPSGSEYDEYLKLKDIYLEKYVPEEFMLDANLLENTVGEFKKTKDFIAILNRCIKFAHEEM